MQEFTSFFLNIPSETLTVEFKRLSGENVVAKCLETIVAFANTDGGLLVLGIDDPEKTKLKGMQRIFGIEESLEHFDALDRQIQKINPPLSPLPSIQKIFVEEIRKTIAVIEVSKAQQYFHAINNQVLIRQEKGNKKLSPQEVVRFSYAKGFEHADRELVDIDFSLLNTPVFQKWRDHRRVEGESIEQILLKVGLARSERGTTKPTRAAVMLFADYPSDLMDTKSNVRVLQYAGTVETFGTLNLMGTPKTIHGPISQVIRDCHEYVLNLLRAGVRVPSGFITQYRIPERAIKEAITNAVIHRDYFMKRDIEIRVFEDRVEVESPGLFPYNITRYNIGKERAEGYRNDLLIKHLREFPQPPNLDQNEGVKSMRREMQAQNLYPPVFFTYPELPDSVRTVLYNEIVATEWDKVLSYFSQNKFITNENVRELTGIPNPDKVSKLFKKWVRQGLLIRIDPPEKTKRGVKYKLAGAPDGVKT